MALLHPGVLSQGRVVSPRGWEHTATKPGRGRLAVCCLQMSAFFGQCRGVRQRLLDTEVLVSLGQVAAAQPQCNREHAQASVSWNSQQGPGGAGGLRLIQA